MRGRASFRLELVVVTLFYHFWLYLSTFFFTLSNIYLSTTLLRRYPLFDHVGTYDILSKAPEKVMTNQKMNSIIII